MRQLVIALLSAPIRAYRALLSPLVPGVCRFTPSCSAYALESLHQHGPVKGLWLTARRLARCHPITWLGGSSGFDPVPLSKRHLRP
ncbi:MAG TPA: membrane protein insertion efficiency factor YidD [Rhizomicrobium sp.]|nr:membrane protein insertion efficiency factor YidD [Rhizomicrobium sp.]